LSGRVSILERRTIPVEVSKMKSRNEPLIDEIAELKARLAQLEAAEARMRLTEEDLRKSEAKFRMIAEYTFDWEEWRSPEGKYIYVSPSCERVSGYRRDEFMDDPWLMKKIIHPEDQEVLTDHFGKDFCQLRVLHADFRIVSRSGEVRWISHFCQPVYGPDGTWLGRRASNRDFTDRKRVERDLRKANRALRVLSECGQNMVRATDEETFLSEATKVIVHSGGYRLAWVGFVHENEEKRVRPVAQAGFEEGYLETVKITWDDSLLGKGPTGTAIRTGMPSICKSLLTDSRFAPWRGEAQKRGYASAIALPLTAGGRVFGALNIYAVEPDAFDSEEVSLLKELADELSYAIMGLRTEKERKRAEALLKESEARYKAIVEDQTELICRFLLDGKITYVNQAYFDYFKKGHDEVIGSTFMPFIPDEDRQRVKDHLASLIPESPVATREHRVIDPHGDIRWQQWTDRMVLDEDLRPIEFQSVGRDITERKRAEEALKKSSEKIKMFAYSVSHDLKSPAIATYGLAKLLHKNYRDVLQEKGRNYCDQILKACEHMASLVEQINAYIRTTEVPLHIETVRLNEIIQIVRAEFSSQLSLRQIKWTVPEDLPEVKGDRLSLLRVVRNLVDNAMKYGGHKLSEIRLGCKEEGGFHVFFVEDDGVGIRERDPKKLFGAFGREKTSVGIEGVGLGLAIVKEIAEQHGGDAWVETSRKGGTTIFVSLSKSLQE
jgi:PAS domain S-box-containing protein